MNKNEPATILLVEDDPAHAEIVRRNLADFRAEPRIAHVQDGQAALDFLLRKGAYTNTESSPRPAVILLDLRLPKVDGLEFLRRIKTTAELSKIPAVVLSTSNSPADVAAAYARGAASYLVKPASCKDFSALMKTFSEYWLGWNKYSV